MTTVQIELPEAMARAAREAGLLTPQSLERLIAAALQRRQAAEALLDVAERLAATGAEAMALEDIVTEVKAARAEAGRARGH